MKRFLAKVQRGRVAAPFEKLKKIFFRQGSWKKALPAIFLLAGGLLLLGNFLFPGVKEYSFAGQQAGTDYLPEGLKNEAGGRQQDFRAAGGEPVEGETFSRVMLIILDKITYQDLLSFSGPVLASMLEESAVALMNVNTAGAAGTESGYLTIGSGARLAANWTVRRAFNRRETWHGDEVEALYRRHTGSPHVPPGEVLHLYSGVLQRLNEQRPYPALVGALGESISKKGLGAAVLGNADGDTHNRQVVAIAMNSEGVVAYGEVGSSLLKEKEDFPFGKGSDPLAYLKALESLWEKSSFIVVEWGDTSRIDDYLAHLPHERRDELLRASLQELDQFLQGIRPYLTGGTKLLLLAPSLPNPPFSGGQRLAPVLYHDPASAGPGLLVSATTRRPGVVTNIDIAPTVLNSLGLARPVFLFGAPVRVSPAADHLEKLAALSERIVRIYNQRPAVIRGYLVAQMVLLLGALGGLFFRVKQVKFLQPGLYTLLYFPPAALLAAAFPQYPASSLYANAFLLVALTILLTLFAVYFFRNILVFFSFTGLLNFGLLTVDLFRGAPWISQSFMGYDPVGGARFYGMGNEYMGIMVGSFILGFGSLITLVFLEAKTALEGEKKKAAAGAAVAGIMWLFIFCSFLVLFLMASPVYGANFGGAVTAGVALAVTLGGLLALFKQEGYSLLPFLRHRTAGRKARAFLFPQKVLLLAFFVLVTGALLYFLNIPRSDAAVSHLGRTLDLVRSDGLQELWNIALRKMEMNLRLIRYSLWSRVLFMFIFLITALYFYPVGLTKQNFQEKPGFKATLGGIIAGSFTSFAVNDSGVITAATTMLYGGLPLLLFCFKEVFP